MSALVNARWEIFAHELASGRSATDAYLTAGFEVSRAVAGASGHKLQKKAEIAARIAEIIASKAEIDAKATQLAAEAASVSRAWVMSMLKENVLRSMQAVPVRDSEGTPIGEYRYEGNVANKGLNLLGMEIGMFQPVVAPAVVNNIYSGPQLDLSRASPETLAELREAAIEAIKADPKLLEQIPYKVVK